MLQGKTGITEGFELKLRGSGGLEFFLKLMGAIAVFLVWTTYWFVSCDRKLVLAVALAFGVVPLMLLVAQHFNMFGTPRRRVAVFSIALTYACVLFSLLFPPFSAPDEYHHYLSSYWLSNCVSGESTVDNPETLEMRRDDWNLYSDYGRRDESLDYQTFTIDAASYQKIIDDFSLMKQSECTVAVPEGLMFSFSLGSENAVAKVGSVFGLLLGKALGLGAYPVFYLGRICSALFFIACAAAAVHLAPVGKNAFMAISFFPMTLHLASSYSYDGGTIGLSFLFISLALRVLFAEGPVSRATFVGLALSAICLAPCKAVYVLELVLIVVLPTRRFASRREAVAYKLIVLSCATIAVLVSKFATVASLSEGTTVFMFPGESTYSIADLLADPLASLALFFRTFVWAGDSYIISVVGANLGWLQENLGAPYYLVWIYLIAAVFSVQPADDDVIEVSVLWKCAFFLVVCAVWFAVMLSMAVAWTPKSMETIQGVQGRYVLPVLPLLLLALRSRRVIISGETYGTVLVVFSMLNALYIVRFVSLALVA